MNIYKSKYKKNPEYETSDMGGYLSVFTGNLEQVFFLRNSEIEMFNLFDTAISVDDAVSIMIDLYAVSKADRINIENDCKQFLTNLIENQILVEDTDTTAKSPYLATPR